MARPAPLLRIRNLAFGLVALVLLIVGLVAVHVAGLTPGKAGKFNGELRELIGDGQPADAPDRWSLFQQVIRGYMAVDDPLRLAARPADWPQGLSWPPKADELDPSDDPAARGLRELLARHDRAGLGGDLDQLALARRFVRPIPPGRLLDVQLPELTPVRSVSQLSLARFRLALIDGNQAEAIRGLEHQLVLADVLRRQSTLIEQVIAVACRARALDALREAATAGQLTPDSLRRALDLLDQRAGKLEIGRVFRGEHIFARDAVEWTHSDDGNGDGSLIPSRVLPLMSGPGAPASNLPPFIANFASLAAPSKKATLGAFERFYTLSEQYAETPFRQRASAPSPDEFFQSLPQNMILVRVMAPALSSFVRHVDADELSVAAAKMTLALELHKAAHGEYPGSLSELGALRIDPQWLPELRYRPARQPADPKPYFLYWIGRDGVDDQGRRPPKTEARTPFHAPEGFDFVFVPVRPSPESPEPPASPASPRP